MNKHEFSTAHIIYQAPRSTKNNPIYSVGRNIPNDRVVLVALGGAETKDERISGGYITYLSDFLKKSGFSDINVYSAIYSFGSIQPELLKVNLFRRAGRKVKIEADNAAQQEKQLKQINENEPIPEYAMDLYDELIEPRIIPGNTEQTIQNMRNLVIFAHCHGAVALNLIADVTRAELKQMGFADSAINTILKSIVAIQHNPVGPLEKSPMTTVSFLSASDDALQYYNDFSKNVIGKHDLAPSFLGNEYGNVFVAGKLKTGARSEHGFSDGYRDDADMRLTNNGKIIFDAEQHAVLNVIRAAQNKLPIPTPQQMIGLSRVDFAKMRTNGNKLNAIMNVKQNRVRVNQK